MIASLLAMSGACFAGPGRPPAALPDVLPIKSIQCINEQSGAVYRLVDRTKYHYPNPEIAASYDPNWHSNILRLDCQHFTNGPPLNKAPAQGQAIKCSAHDPRIYRYHNGYKLHYADPTAAAKYDSENWNKPITVDCRGIPSGPSLNYDPIFGF